MYKGNRPEREAESGLNLKRIVSLLRSADARSPSQLIVHGVFSTRDRRPFLHSEEILIEIYAYMADVDLRTEKRS